MVDIMSTAAEVVNARQGFSRASMCVALNNLAHGKALGDKDKLAEHV